ncbi:MAG: DinB family protein [Balneolaceae bacterium]|nr:DinB family protein [Balneolaceae bacterium]
MNIKPDEYGEYYSRYITLSNNKSLSDLLGRNTEIMEELFGKLNSENSLLRYEKGKWSIKEVIGHIVDTERVFNYRALSIARDEKSELPGYDHDIFVQNAHFDEQSLDQLQKQYQAVRQSTVTLWGSFSDDDYLKKGVVNSVPFTVRALCYVIAGHEMHHIKILNERYLPLL